MQCKLGVNSVLHLLVDLVEHIPEVTSEEIEMIEKKFNSLL